MEKPVTPQEKLAPFDAQPKPPSFGPPPHLLWKAAPKSKMAMKLLEAQIEQSTSSKAPPPRPKPSSSIALATPPPKLPPRKALPPPPPRPMAVEAFGAPTSSEVQKVPSKEKLELEPDKAEDDEKDSWTWWKGRWWHWDWQEKKYIEVEQIAHGWAQDPASHDWQNGSWQEQFWNSKESSFSNDSAEEKKACPLNSWTQNWRNKASQDEDKPSCQEGGWNGEDWKDWKNSSDWTWNSWNSKEKWIQDERYKEKDIEREESPTGQWANLLRKWEDEKTEKLKELASSETCCREVDTDEEDGLVRQMSDDESIREEEEQEDDHEELIKRTREVLQRHRAGKRGRSPLPQEPPYPPPKNFRMGRSGKAVSKRAKARYAKLDDKRELSKVEVGELHYSQLSDKETFQCGRSISQLVQDLLDRKVSLSAPFLRLTVFETTDEKKNEPILRCIDNHRLFALKEYAKKSGKDRVMVNVNLFSQDTLKQVQRFMQNSDDTDGRDVRLRRNRNDKRRQPLI